MDIFKAIKLYFGVATIAMSMAAVSYNDDVRYYMSSILTFDSDQSSEIQTPDFDWSAFDYRDAKVKLASYKAPAEPKPVTLPIFFQNISGGSYASVAEQGAPMMQIVLSDQEGEVSLKNIRFKIVGDESYIKSAMISDENGNFVSGKIDDGYIIFRGMDFASAPGEETTLTLTVDLTESTRPGQRLRFDIEKADDLELYLNEELLKKGSYPIQTPYLTVVKKSF